MKKQLTIGLSFLGMAGLTAWIVVLAVRFNSNTPKTVDQSTAALAYEAILYTGVQLGMRGATPRDIQAVARALEAGDPEAVQAVFRRLEAQ